MLPLPTWEVGVGLGCSRLAALVISQQVIHCHGTQCRVVPLCERGPRRLSWRATARPGEATQGARARERPAEATRGGPGAGQHHLVRRWRRETPEPAPAAGSCRAGAGTPRDLGATRLPGAGAAAWDVATVPARTRGRSTAGRARGGLGEPVWALRLPPGHGSITWRRLVREPQAG